MSNVSYAFVKITDVSLGEFSGGVFKQVRVIEEVGYWMNKFSFNIFPDNSLYTLMERGTTLYVKVAFSFHDPINGINIKLKKFE